MAGEVSEIEEGCLVVVIPPKERRDLEGADFGVWVVLDVFENTGRYKEIPLGSTVRLHQAFQDNWILPLENVKLKE